MRVAGELDIATAPQLERTLREAEERARRVVLDLRELPFMDSSGVHVALDAAERYRRAARQLVLVRGPTHIDRVFELTGTSDALQTVDLDKFQPPAQALLQLAHRRASLV